jgi:hypothetical protein
MASFGIFAPRTRRAIMKSLTTPDAGDEIGVLAMEMANNFGQAVRFYQEHFKLSCEEAFNRINDNPEADKQRILKALPDQISWIDMHQLGNIDAGLALELWDAIKQAALEELQSGHRAAQAIAASGQSPWEKAQFLALRKDLADEWQPRNGMERQLIDTMAQAQTSFLYWLNVLTVRTCLESYKDKRLKETDNCWQGPRLNDAEALAQAGEMMDRFNRIFLRTLRALRDLRRYAGPVIVQKGGQLNVANQQVNVKQDGPEE